MRTKTHNIRINVAEQSGGNTNVLESVTESIPKKLFNKLFNSKRKVLIIAPSYSLTGIEIFEKGGNQNASTNRS